MKKITKWILIIFVTLMVIGAIAGSGGESDIGKYAYNATNNIYQGKIIEVKPCNTKSSITCYVTDFGDIHNQYSGAKPTEHPVDNVNVKDNISNPKEDLKYIYGSEYCVLESCILETQEPTQKVEQEKEKDVQPTLKPTSIPTPTPTWYKGEYKITTIDKQEGMEDYDVGTINVWPSYEDRSHVLFKLINNETIKLIDYDLKHDYCKIQKSEKSGWIACGWIKNMPKSPKSYPTLTQVKEDANKYVCDCSKNCSQMIDCKDAYFQFNDCGCVKRDNDNDGIPCESICL